MDMAISNIGVDSPAFSQSAVPVPADNVPRKSAATSGSSEAFDKEGVKRLVEEMQRNMDHLNVALQFSTYGEKGKKVAITVSDRETGKVIREIPPKDLQDLYMRMNELAGMMFNKVA